MGKMTARLRHLAAISSIFRVARAILFAIVINGPYLIEFVITDGHSPSVFSDSDETIYLRQAYFISENLPFHSVYKEHAKHIPLRELILSWRPDQTFTHLAVGVFASTFHLSILELNLILDLFCTVVGYLLFVLLIRELIPGLSRIKAEIGAFFFFASPWIFSLENYITVHSVLPSVSSVFPLMFHSCLPIQEAIETQLGVIWMLLCLYTWNKSRSGSNRALILTGIIHGLFVYVYVLGWVATGVLLGLLIALENLFPARKNVSSSWELSKKIIIFSSSSLLASSLGLYLIFKKTLNEPLYSSYGSIYSQVWYSPLEWLIVLLIAVAAFIIIRRSHNSKQAYTLTLLFICTLLAEFLLLNFQPLVGTTLCGGYMLLLYLRPLMTASTVLLLLSGFSEKLVVRRFLILFYTALLAVFVIYGNTNFQKNSQFSSDSTELVRYLKSAGIANNVLAFITNEKAFSDSASEFSLRREPNAIAAATGNYLLHEAVITPYVLMESKEMVDREMLLGLIFTGKAALTKQCIREIRTEPKHIFFLEWISSQAARIELCRQTEEYQQTISNCDIVKKYEVDFIVLETMLQHELPPATLSFSTLIWSSSNKEYEVYKFDKHQAVSVLCDNSDRHE